MTFEQEFRATLVHIEESLTRIQLCVLALRRLSERIQITLPGENSPQENRPDFDYMTGGPPKGEHG